MSVFWVAVGAGLLYAFVRERSFRTWVITLLVVGSFFILVAGTTAYGNVTGSLDYRNWVLLRCRYSALVSRQSPSSAATRERTDRRTTTADFRQVASVVEDPHAYPGDVRREITFGQPKARAARRTISIPAWLVDVLAEHLTDHPGDDDLTFTAPAGGPLRRTSFRSRHWKPAVGSSVGAPCRFHDLQHTHGAPLIERGVHRR